MIDVIFQYAGEIILVKVRGNSVTFGSTMQGTRMASIDGLKLSKIGVIKEFPDLEGNDEWRVEAILRFKEKIKSLISEDKKVEYIIGDLKKHGYIPKKMQISGRRPRNL